MFLSRTPFFARDANLCTRSSKRKPRSKKLLFSLPRKSENSRGHESVTPGLGLVWQILLLCPPSRQILAQTASGRNGPAGGESDPL